MEPAAIESRGVPRDWLPASLGGVSYPVCSTAANVDARRVLTLSAENPAAAALLGNLDLHVSIGKQDYKGLKLSFRRRSAGGVSLNGNYTRLALLWRQHQRRVPAARAGLPGPRRIRRGIAAAATRIAPTWRASRLAT